MASLPSPMPPLLSRRKVLILLFCYLLSFVVYTFCVPIVATESASEINSTLWACNSEFPFTLWLWCVICVLHVLLDVGTASAIIMNNNDGKLVRQRQKNGKKWINCVLSIGRLPDFQSILCCSGVWASSLYIVGSLYIYGCWLPIHTLMGMEKV
jgi:hypothetical protein